MKKLKLIFVAITLIASYTLTAQVSINNDGADPDPSAMLDVSSTNAGFLPPCMTELQMNAITDPAEGLMVYCTDCSPKSVKVYNGSYWVNSDGNPYNLETNEVFNPATGKIWMDRNLGASQVATSSTDAPAYGDLYQWGRATEGHESRTSGQTSTNATTATPNDGNAWDGLFITESSSPFDWLTPQDNTLWQGISGTNNPCPAGFRLPTEAEWETEHLSWSSNNAAGAFDSPLKLVVGGYHSRTSGLLGSVGSNGYYWSSSVSGTNAQRLNFNSSGGAITPGSRADGFTVRCIKNEINPATYSIGTGESCSNTTLNGTYGPGITLNGSNTANIEVNVTTKGNWSITTNAVNGYSFSGCGTFTSTGTVQVTLEGSGTPVNTQIDNFTATADNNGGTCIFDVTVAHSCGYSFTDTRDSQSYTTVQIGTQCWMEENLNIGTMINSTNGGTNNDGEQTDNGTIEKYCYNNSAANCDTYGGLYQWGEMMQYVTTGGTQGICPTNWHLPTDAEWCTLENYVDAGTVSCSATGWRGIDAGGNLKESGTTHWLSPNTGATNSSGFTGLPGGYRHTDGSFSREGYNGYFWSSSESGSGAWRRYLGGGKAQVYRDDYSQAYGFSVRCVRD